MMAAMAETILRTSTAVVAGASALAARVTEQLGRGAIAVRRVDPSTPHDRMREALEGVETVVLLDVGSGVDLDGTGGSDLDLAAVRRLLVGAEAAGVRSLVVLSSAMVYGAREDNPVPLTEDAPIRPEPQLPYALARAELERLVADYRSGATDRTAAVLRPAVILSSASTEWLRRSAWGRRGLPPDDNLAPRQFVHVDDAVGAVVVACEQRLDGTYNVAPDGWIAGDTFLELVGGARLPLPGRLRRMVRSARRTWSRSSLPEGLEPYTRAPWVVAGDRLRAVGWEAAHSSEETYVDADPARGWRALSPRARQELSLGVVGAAVVGALAAAYVVVRRRRRH
jgi:nucleoside-diphosphate-sugar epimerase